jgi:hypothetical protein
MRENTNKNNKTDINKYRSTNFNNITKKQNKKIQNNNYRRNDSTTEID